MPHIRNVPIYLLSQTERFMLTIGDNIIPNPISQYILAQTPRTTKGSETIINAALHR